MKVNRKKIRSEIQRFTTETQKKEFKDTKEAIENYSSNLAEAIANAIEDSATPTVTAVIKAGTTLRTTLGDLILLEDVVVDIQQTLQS